MTLEFPLEQEIELLLSTKDILVLSFNTTSLANHLIKLFAIWHPSNRDCYDQLDQD